MSCFWSLTPRWPQTLADPLTPDWPQADPVHPWLMQSDPWLTSPNPCPPTTPKLTPSDPWLTSGRANLTPAQPHLPLANLIWPLADPWPRHHSLADGGTTEGCFHGEGVEDLHLAEHNDTPRRLLTSPDLELTPTEVKLIRSLWNGKNRLLYPKNEKNIYPVIKNPIPEVRWKH